MALCIACFTSAIDLNVATCIAEINLMQIENVWKIIEMNVKLGLTTDQTWCVNSAIKFMYKWNSPFIEKLS